MKLLQTILRSSMAVLMTVVLATCSVDDLTKLQKQAAAGDPEAQHNLGAMYQNGEGVPQDKSQAVTWYQKAAAQGHEKAIKNRDLVKQDMTTEQIAEEERRSLQCQQSNYQDC